jgi:cytochrome c-type biogenesis protein CcmE
VKKKYLLGVLILVPAIGYLIFLSFSSSVSYYVTVSEFFSRGTELYDTTVRVAGTISEPIDWNAEAIELGFTITEGGRNMAVIYHGTRPSGFKPGSSILVEGKYGPEDIFKASQIILKCPSKYELEE